MLERHSIRYNGFTTWYDDPHDIPAIIEGFVLNVYSVQNIKNGNTVVDIGSGVGEFAILASNKVGKEGKVIAIEPSPYDLKH